MKIPVNYYRHFQRNIIKDIEMIITAVMRHLGVEVVDVGVVGVQLLKLNADDPLFLRLRHQIVVGLGHLRTCLCRSIIRLWEN